jgi:MFS family permease
VSGHLRTEEAARRPRGTVRLLFDLRFGTLVWGKILSSTAYWMHTVVASIFVYQQTDSALLVGLVVAGQLLPQLLLGPFSGSLADRGHALAQIVAGRIVIALGTGTLGAWFAWTGNGGDYGVAATIVCSFVAGLGFALGGPALQALVPDLVSRAELPVAMALNTAPITISAIAGPSIGAVVSAQLGAPAAFGIAAAMHLVFATALLIVRLPKRRPEGVDTDFSMRSALRYFQTDRTLLALLLGIAGVGFGAEPSVTLAPPLVAELDAPAEMVGVLTGGFGVGAAVGLILFSSMNRWISTITLSAVGVSVMAVGLAVVGSAPVLPMAVTGFVLCGFGYTLAITTMSAMVQQRAPDHLRGRIMALWLMAMLGARPAAAALEGLIADLTSVRIAVFISITALLAVLVLTRPSRLSEIDRVHERCSVK